MFSVIIPLYNKAAYIEKAIRSVLSQTYQEFELIIVDDGSTDDSLEKLRFLSSEFGEEKSFEFGVLSSGSNTIISQKRVRVYHQINQGVSTARNNGVRLAKYDYIAFLDADDWWEPTYLEEMKGLIEEFPQAGIYASSYYKVKEGKNIPAAIGVDSDFKRGIINYLKAYTKSLYQPVWTGATIVRKTVFEAENGFKPLLKLGEDFDLWVRIAVKHPVALLNKPLAYYNQDVDITNRAIGQKLYEPQQHMLFTDYGELKENPEFVKLFEILALYSLLPYYFAKKNELQVKQILSKIDWSQHDVKYRLYYKFLPRPILKMWFSTTKYLSILKNSIQKLFK